MKALFLTASLLVLVQSYQHTHEGTVGEFYQGWMQPEIISGQRRWQSCCDQTHCRPVFAMQRSTAPAYLKATWDVQVMGPDGHGGTELSGWYAVPDHIWEDAQPDPRDSPDGRAHVCILAGRVVCAVRGSDQ